jgi:YD repeat-containing protein
LQYDVVGKATRIQDVTGTSTLTCDELDRLLGY